MGEGFMGTQTSLLMTGQTKPEEALLLPKGRLKIGEFVADFSPEQVLSAATSIVDRFERVEGHEVERLFVSQSGVVAYAAEEFSWFNSLKFDTF